MSSPTINATNNLNFNQLLTARVQETFDEEEARIYAMNFKAYLEHDPTNEFVVDFDDVWRWLGFSRKDPAVRLLTNKFVKEKDYQVGILRTVGTSVPAPPTAQFKLTVNCFKKFCLKADTKKADKVTKL